MPRGLDNLGTWQRGSLSGVQAWTFSTSAAAHGEAYMCTGIAKLLVHLVLLLLQLLLLLPLLLLLLRVPLRWRLRLRLQLPLPDLASNVRYLTQS